MVADKTRFNGFIYGQSDDPNLERFTQCNLDKVSPFLSTLNYFGSPSNAGALRCLTTTALVITTILFYLTRPQKGFSHQTVNLFCHFLCYSGQNVL